MSGPQVPDWGRRRAGTPGRPAPSRTPRPGAAGGGPPRTGRTQPGIALLLALATVVVLTAFLSELFLDTGLEMRAVANFRDSDQAQSLTRSAFKAAELSLRGQPETDFAFGYDRLEALLQVSAIPFEGGLLTKLRVSSLDHLYNVNELTSIQPGSGKEALRWALFRNAVAAMPKPAEVDGRTNPEITERQVAALFSALVDWVDDNDIEYIGMGVAGAERRAYSNLKPEYEIKNAPLERLEEMRLVQGFMEMHLPWPEIERRFTALPRAQKADDYLTEKLDVNLASREQIVRYLTERIVDDPKVLGSDVGTVQKSVNELAAKAGAIGAALVPDGFDRTYFKTTNDLGAALQKADIKVESGRLQAAVNSVFKTCSDYLSVQASVDVGGTAANLDATLKVTRAANCGPATGVDLLRFTVR